MWDEYWLITLVLLVVTVATYIALSHGFAKTTTYGETPHHFYSSDLHST